MRSITTGLGVILFAGTATVALAANTTISPNEVRAEKLIGASVYDRSNQDVASVADLVLSKSGKVDNVVLNYGSVAGVGGKYVAISYSNLKFDNDRIAVDMTKDQLAAMPTYQLENSNTGAGEASVPPTGGHATSGGSQ
jgi:sporulation protein YlmC with PRC-barrel domain